MEIKQQEALRREEARLSDMEKILSNVNLSPSIRIIDPDEREYRKTNLAGDLSAETGRVLRAHWPLIVGMIRQEMEGTLKVCRERAAAEIEENRKKLLTR